MEKHETISPRVSVGFDPLWVETHYGPLFEEHIEYFFYPLLKTHSAWITMLAECGVVPTDSAIHICKAIDELNIEGPEVLRPFIPEYGDVYVHVEKYLENKIGKTHVGHLALARTRPEPIARLVLRQKLVEIIDEVLLFLEKILITSEEHSDTVITGYTHAQPAQATTYGHYLLSVYDPISEDLKFLEDAFDNVNRCTLGCGALAGTSFKIDRYRVADLLGFNGIVENTFACVGSNDFMVNSANAIVDIFVTLSRVLSDFMEWSSYDIGMMLTAPQFSSYSSLMPQKYNTTVIEGGRVKCAHCINLAHNVSTRLMKGHYGDVKEIDLSWNPTFQTIDHSKDVIKLIGEVIRTMQIDKQKMLELAENNYCTASELSDQIYISRNIPYRKAHAIVGNVINFAIKNKLKATDVTSKMVDDAAILVTGEPINLSEEDVKNSLDPKAFVARRNLVGGPAPEEVLRMIKIRKEKLNSLFIDQKNRKDRLASSEGVLKEAVNNLTKEGE
ncbi:MAG: argininosuccinate lyase [Balneolaceae bacterium]